MAWHYSDVIMSPMASQITGPTVVYSTFMFSCRWKKISKLCVTGLCGRIHRWPVNSPLKGPVTRKMFHLMTSSWNFIDTLFLLTNVSLISGSFVVGNIYLTYRILYFAMTINLCFLTIIWTSHYHHFARRASLSCNLYHITPLNFI